MLAPDSAWVWRMSELTRDGTPNLTREMELSSSRTGTGKSSADHEENLQPYAVDATSAENDRWRGLKSPRCLDPTTRRLPSSREVKRSYGNHFLAPDRGHASTCGCVSDRRVWRLYPHGRYSDARIPAGVEAQVAWRNGDITLFRTVPNAQACPEIPEESDLVQGVYEGGLKVWEASLDLVEHLLTLDIGGIGRRIDSREGIGLPCLSASESAHARAECERPSQECTGSHPGKDASHAKGCLARVLELGCGHGLPGIMALRQGLHVCFSDFNREVIEQVTMPNVRLNVPEHYLDRADYYSGDWSSLSPLLDDRKGGGRFDLILTAETLYTTAVADKVLGMILRHLARDGLALVASKRFYFGTGGSTQYFRQQAALDGRLACVDVAVVNTGRGNIREVIRVAWREGQGPLEGARCHNMTK